MKPARCDSKVVLVLIFVLSGEWPPQPAAAQRLRMPQASSRLRTPGTYRSANVVVRTDLPQRETEALLQRLENTLHRVSRYWGRPSQGMIECFVAQDVSGWPDSALPHPMARLSLARIGGFTIAGAARRDGRLQRKAVVYATAEVGIAEHEIVHAYCLQTFGACGPTWYKEGMSEMGFHGIDRMPGVRCPPEFVEFFRTRPFRSLDDVIESGAFTDDISRSLEEIAVLVRGSAAKLRQVPVHAWTERHAELVAKARETYRWSWALCHLLSQNPNYSDRFRALGHGFLTGRGNSFEQAFAGVRPQVEFEYHFFIQRFDIGYRVDLCRWDWTATFRPLLTDQQFVTARVQAARGYQPTRLTVNKGSGYAYRCRGRWTTNPNMPATTANGREDGRGRLMAVILHDLELSDPFELGEEGTFTAPCDGDLYVRCQDQWNQLVDNQGQITLHVKGADPRARSAR